MRIPDWLKITPEWTIKTIDLNSMALPARLSLWLGVVMVIFSYLIETYALTVLGLILIAVGGALWHFHHPDPWGRLRRLHEKYFGARRPTKQLRQQKQSAQERVDSVSRQKAKLKDEIEKSQKALKNMRDVKKRVDPTDPRA